MSRRIARPYAAAMFKVMEKHGTDVLRQVADELAAVAEAFRTREEVLRAFEVPSVPPATKQRLLQAIGTTLGLRVETRRLLAALEQHYRLRFTGEVADAFRALVDRREGITRGVVELPEPASGEQLASLSAAVGGMLGSRVVLESAVRPELLAGFVLRVGSQVYDGSLRSQLRRFARENSPAGTAGAHR